MVRCGYDGEMAMVRRGFDGVVVGYDGDIARRGSGSKMRLK